MIFDSFGTKFSSLVMLVESGFQRILVDSGVAEASDERHVSREGNPSLIRALGAALLPPHWSETGQARLLASLACEWLW